MSTSQKDSKALARSGNQTSNSLSLRDAMNRLFDESIWDPFAPNAHDSFFRSFSHDLSNNTPSVDISETKKEFLIEADVPGFSSNDLDVEIDENVLTIRASKEASNEEDKDKTYYLKERNHAYWERSFTLPSNVDSEKVDCEVDHGQLRIHVPKAAKASTKKISIRQKK